MDICEDCYYLTRTRYGRVCGFDGTYNPHKEKCPNFIPREENKQADRLVKKELSLRNLDGQRS